MRTTGPGQAVALLLDAVTVLKKARVDYAVIGAVAGSFHGVIRASIDADAVISLKRRRLESLEKDFQNAGFITEHRRGGLDDPISSLLALKDVFGNRVDLLTGIKGLDPGVWKRTRVISLLEENLKIVGLEDFLSMKIFAGSPRDLEDVRQTLDVSKKHVNIPLLKKLTRRFGPSLLKTLGHFLRDSKSNG